jgi:hypothetical protein
MRCNASHFTDTDAVGSVVEALDRWISEYPDQAKDVEHLSLSACYAATLQHQSGAAVRLGTAGLDASLIRPKPEAEDQASAVLLALLAAETCLREGRLREGQTLLDDVAHSLRDLDVVGPLAPYLIQRLELVAGALSEAALDKAAAAPHFARSLEAGEPLLRNRIRLRSLARHWTPMVFGKGPDLVQDGEEQVTELLKYDLLRTYRYAALGYARTADDPVVGARCAVAACAEFGLPPDASTLELRPVLLALPAAEIEKHLEALLNRANELPTERRRAVWRAMMRLVRGRVLARSGDSDAMAKAYEESSSDLAMGSDGMTWTGAFGDMLVTREPSEQSVGTFLLTYCQGAAGDPVAPLSFPLRVQFDDAIAAANSWAFEELHARPSSQASRTLSLLLDTLRAPEVEELRFVAPHRENGEPFPGQLFQAYEMAFDRLGRLQYAMTQLPRSCAVAMQTVGERVLFAAATGDEQAPLVLVVAGADYLKAAKALAGGLRDAIRSPRLDTTERVEELGRAAFEALSAELRTLLRTRKSIYLMPDFWAEREGMPFELLHDGQDFLCLGKVIARSLSLRELVRAVEPPVVRQGIPQRAVCLAVTEAEGLPTLEYAVPEVRDAKLTLERAGWDVPDTESMLLSPSRLLDAIELAGVTHIAAHGKIYAGGEALVLRNGSTLTVEEIEERPRLFGGLVFLNACSLGRTRYLGGGLTRGIAAALVRGGAPCVIANLLPVEDSSARVLAASFYQAAQRRGAGEALRLARKNLADRGVPPSRWGTTILLGDPQFRISARSARAEPSSEPAADLLYRYSVPDDARADAPSSMLHALAVIEAAPYHTRLRGAVEWVRAAANIRPDTPPEEALVAARVARALDCRPGEALFLHAATNGIKEPAQLRRSLDQAIWALEPLAPLNDIWHRMHIEMLARRKKLDARREIPFFIDAGVRVNDPDDRATQAAGGGTCSAVHLWAPRPPGVVEARPPAINPGSALWLRGSSPARSPRCVQPPRARPA